MRDRRLEEQIVQMEEFLAAWRRFRESWPSQKNAGPFDAQHEVEFLNLQRGLARAAQKVGSGEGDPLRVLSETASLAGLQKMLPEDRLRVEKEWHATLMRAEAALGQLEARRIELAGVNTLGFWLGRALRQPLVVVALVLVVVAVIFFVVGQFDLLPRR